MIRFIAVFEILVLQRKDMGGRNRNPEIFPDSSKVHRISHQLCGIATRFCGNYRILDTGESILPSPAVEPASGTGEGDTCIELGNQPFFEEIGDQVCRLPPAGTHPFREEPGIGGRCIGTKRPGGEYDRFSHGNHGIYSIIVKRHNDE